MGKKARLKEQRRLERIAAGTLDPANLQRKGQPTKSSRKLQMAISYAGSNGGATSKEENYRHYYVSGESGFEAVRTRNQLVEVRVSSKDSVVKRIDELVEGDEVRVDKVVGDFTLQDLEKIVLQKSERLYRAKHRYMKIAEKGNKMPLLGYCILEHYRDKGLFSSNDIVGDLVNGKIPTEVVSQIATDLYGRLKKYVESQNSSMEMVLPQTVRKWIVGGTVLPRDKRFLILLAELHEDLVPFRDSFEKNRKDREYIDPVIVDYNFLGTMTGILNKFVPKYQQIIEGMKRTGILPQEQLPDLLTYFEACVEEKEAKVEEVAAANANRKALGSDLKRKIGQENYSWIRKYIDPTPEIIALMEHFEGCETETSWVRIRKPQKISPRQYESIKRRLETSSPVVKGRLYSHDSDHAESKPKTTSGRCYLTVKQRIETYSVFNAMTDEIILRYIKHHPEGYQGFDWKETQAIDVQVMKYFGASNTFYDIQHEAWTKRSVPIPGDFLGHSKKFIEDILSGKVDAFFGLENGTFMKFIETNVRIKNCVPAEFWEANRLAFMGMVEAQQTGGDPVMNPFDVPYKDRVLELYRKLREKGYMGEKRLRLLSGYLFEGPVNMIDNTQEAFRRGVDTSSNPEENILSLLLINANMDLVAMLAETIFANYDPIDLLDEPEKLKPIASLITLGKDSIMSKQEFHSLLKCYDIGDCKNLVHPNNFMDLSELINYGG